jgi:hypothetical protein
MMPTEIMYEVKDLTLYPEKYVQTFKVNKDDPEYNGTLEIQESLEGFSYQEQVALGAMFEAINTKNKVKIFKKNVYCALIGAASVLAFSTIKGCVEKSSQTNHLHGRTSIVQHAKP